MNHGPKFLEMTVGDALKKFHDPESIFWVSNNNFLKTVARKIAKCGGLGLFLSHIPNKKIKYGKNICMCKRQNMVIAHGGTDMSHEQ